MTDAFPVQFGVINLGYENTDVMESLMHNLDIDIGIVNSLILNHLTLL